MKTLTQISNQIKAAFVANEVLQEAYGLDAELTFDEQFSAVSIESAIVFVVAYTWYLLEQIMAAFRTEIDERIENAYLASIPWYYAKCLEYQHGHDLVFNPSTYRFEYEEEDLEARIVKFAAVRQVQDSITKLKIYTNKAGKVPLSTAEHNAFKAYIAQIGAAGIHYQFVNASPDELQIEVQIIFNPLLMDNSGQSLADSSFPAQDAISTYIDELDFGGTFNRTKLVDAIQSAEGVEDVILVELKHKSAIGGDFVTITGQNIESLSGSFVIDTLTDTYTPNV